MEELAALFPHAAEASRASSAAPRAEETASEAPTVSDGDLLNRAINRGLHRTPPETPAAQAGEAQREYGGLLALLQQQLKASVEVAVKIGERRRALEARFGNGVRGADDVREADMTRGLVGSVVASAEHVAAVAKMVEELCRGLQSALPK